MHRRSLLTGLVTALAAPAIVRAESLMPLWVPKPRLVFGGVGEGVAVRWVAGPQLLLWPECEAFYRAADAALEADIAFALGKQWAA